MAALPLLTEWRTALSVSYTHLDVYKRQDLLRLLANHADRLSRKIANQQAELSACAERDTLRIKGDLLSANMYCLLYTSFLPIL